MLGGVTLVQQANFVVLHAKQQRFTLVQQANFVVLDAKQQCFTLVQQANFVVLDAKQQRMLCVQDVPRAGWQSAQHVRCGASVVVRFHDNDVARCCSIAYCQSSTLNTQLLWFISIHACVRFAETSQLISQQSVHK